MSSLQDELNQIKHQHKILREEWMAQQEHIGQLQSEVIKFQCQLQQQSSFCATLGATLGHMMWRASRYQDTVQRILTWHKKTDFLAMVTGTLTSFIDTYATEIPSQNTDESQFVMSMIGIVTNIAAASEGRSFLVSDTTSKQMIESFISAMKSIPIPSGDCLKRLILMTIYNISINKEGLEFLQDNENLINVLDEIIKQETGEINIMALKLIQSLTSDFDGLRTIHNISKDSLQKLATSSDNETRVVAQNILKNLETRNNNGMQQHRNVESLTKLTI